MFFGILGRALTNLGVDQETRLWIWFVFLGLVTIANLLLAFVERGWWRVVFLITGLLTPVSGVVAGTLGMGYILHSPYVLIEVLKYSFEMLLSFLEKSLL